MHEGEAGGLFGGSLHAYARCAQAGYMEGHMNKVRQPSSSGPCHVWENFHPNIPVVLKKTTCITGRYLILQFLPACRAHQATICHIFYCWDLNNLWRGLRFEASSCYQVSLPDGTIRSTFATTTNKSLAMPLPSAVALGCPDFAASANDLRRSVDKMGQACARVLDRLVHGVSPKEAVDQRVADSFHEAIQR